MGSHAIRERSLDQPRAAFVALRRIVRFLRIADREAEAAHGLSAAQLFVLHTLHEAPARSLQELADRTLTDQSSVSTVVARLVTRKLVRRTVAATDRRRTEIHLTTSGERVARTAPRVPQTHMIRAIQAMPEAKRRELVRSLEGLAAAIGATEVAPRLLFEDEPPPSRPRGRK